MLQICWISPRICYNCIQCPINMSPLLLRLHCCVLCGIDIGERQSVFTTAHTLMRTPNDAMHSYKYIHIKRLFDWVVFNVLWARDIKLYSINQSLYVDVLTGMWVHGVTRCMYQCVCVYVHLCVHVLNWGFHAFTTKHFCLSTSDVVYSPRWLTEPYWLSDCSYEFHRCCGKKCHSLHRSRAPYSLAWAGSLWKW